MLFFPNLAEANQANGAMLWLVAKGYEKKSTPKHTKNSE